MFPSDMKAAPLLARRLARLRGAGVRFPRMRHRTGRHWSASTLPPHPALHHARRRKARIRADAVIIALGGREAGRGSPSDGAWVPELEAHGAHVARRSSPLEPCGFDIDWSAHFSGRFARGEPLKSVAIRPAEGAMVPSTGARAKYLVTETGIEGGLVYALSARIRERLKPGDGAGTTLLPRSRAGPVARAGPRRSRAIRAARFSMSGHLQSRLHLAGVKAGLLRECVSKEDFAVAETLARRIHYLPVRPPSHPSDIKDSGFSDAT